MFNRRTRNSKLGIVTFDQTVLQPEFFAQALFLARHLSIVGFMVVTCKMQNAVENEDL